MASIELYINRQLCDIENPDNFSVYLKRQLINPAELSTKDAQRSYDVTLPATATNNVIFGHINTEEVKGKFSQLYDAQLLVNGIKVFDGKFKLSEITKTTYKGNLGIPAPKTVKDIFGEMKMNEAGEWKVPFKEVTDITKYNKDQIPESKYCFFPLVLYGLLPKESKNNVYTAKDELDSTVAFELKHFPPSINCLEAIKKIFENAIPKLSITGTAFGDERLTNLFMSYKNPDEYVMPWNYGKMANVSINCKWSNLSDDNKVEALFHDHRSNEHFFIADMLHGSNSKVTIKGTDSGKMIDQTPTIHDNGQEIKHTHITIPISGLYKIKFDAEITLDKAKNKSVSGNNTRVVSSYSNFLFPDKSSNFDGHRFELKVLRQKVAEPIDYRSIGYDNVFYQDNMEQKDDEDYTQAKYFPEVGGVNFVDIKQNPYLLCGLSFGKNGDNPLHPLERRGGLYCNPIAKKHGKSWDIENIQGYTYSATHCPVYYEAIQQVEGRTLFKPTSRYTVNVKNTPFENRISRDDDYMAGRGQICQVVWLEAGEQITVVSTSDLANVFNVLGIENWAWLHHDVEFNLSIEHFRDSTNWIQIDDDGIVKAEMNWDDDKTYLTNELDLIKFLPSDIKVNDWLDNFCKAFNLNLVQTKDSTFELNVKQTKEEGRTVIIDLDQKANVDMARKNQSLNLPSVYEIGFTVDQNEQGYVKSKEIEGEYNDGGGRFFTGSPEVKTLRQTSNFSYNWYTEIKNTATNKPLLLPVITDKEIWQNGTMDYKDFSEKYYFNKAQRFWYKAGSTFNTYMFKQDPIVAALVSETVGGNKPMILNYKDEECTILHNYFRLLTDAENAYTEIECYLTPDEYNNIADSWVKFNGDLYYVAEIDGYDLLAKKKTTLKLLRRMV